MAVLGNVDPHFPCPNDCGESYSQGGMEDHRKICHLEEITCEFSKIGCEEKFRRERKEEHNQINIQKHLLLLASTHELQQTRLKEVWKEAIEKKMNKGNKWIFVIVTIIVLAALTQFVFTNGQQLQKLDLQLQQLNLHQNQQDMDLQQLYLHQNQQDMVLQQLFQKEKELKMDLRQLFQKEKELKIDLQQLLQKEKELEVVVQQLLQKEKELKAGLRHQCALSDQVESVVDIGQLFMFNDFSFKKENNINWTSPVLHTHKCGYKFYIIISPNVQWKDEQGVLIELYSMPGAFDHFLDWPAKVNFFFEFTMSEGISKSISFYVEWDKPKELQHVAYFISKEHGGFIIFCLHSNIHQFLRNDIFEFKITKIEL